MKAELYGADWCGYCARARNLLKSEGFDLQWYELDEDVSREEVAERIGAPFRTVPQIFIEDEHIGGYDDLVRHLGSRAA